MTMEDLKYKNVKAVFSKDSLYIMSRDKNFYNIPSELKLAGKKVKVRVRG